MTKKAKNEVTQANPRERAEAAIAEWSAAKADHQVKAQAWRTMSHEAEESRQAGRSLSGEKRLPIVLAELEMLEAEDKAKALGVAASAALDAAERAEGDSLALACAPGDFREALAETLAAEDAARTMLVEAERNRVACIANARKASADLDTRRRAAGLPPPIALPRPQKHFAGGGDAGPAILLEALAVLVKDGPTVPARSNLDYVARLRREADEIRIAAELAHRELEERKKEKEAWEKRRDAEIKRQQDEQHASHAAFVAKAEAARRERKELLEAHKRRSAAE